MKRESDAYLNDILEAIRRIKSYTAELNIKDFAEGTLQADATLRNLEIIGEAVSQLPEEFKEKYPEIPWRDIKDFRNVVAHHYFSLNYKRIWDIIQNELNSLKEQIQTILKKNK
ncbi:MAG: DUF86 domain-containing protein [Nanoarchaeota archaeon]